MVYLITGTIVGWGVDENGENTQTLLQTKMPIVSTETCIYSNREFFSRFTTDKSFCAGFRNGKPFASIYCVCCGLTTDPLINNSV